ncbi:MAG: hypothetical protein LBQ94_07275 [Treponema sp.]|jgi:hypothetical protein|nr:hypothetical protein [Treponema sp.]
MFFFNKDRFASLVNEKEAEKRFAEVKPELEKGDVPAMIIAAFIVFAPVVLLIICVLWLFSSLFGG